MNVAFRVDAGPEIGAGHFMRCLCLADAVRESGATVRFVSRWLPRHLQAMLSKRGYGLASLDPDSAGGPAAELPQSAWPGVSHQTDAEATAVALAGESWDWLVVDHYALDAGWETPLRDSANRILAIDDLADRRHDCDLLLDQNIGADDRYDERVPAHCERLLGPRYALLRQEFRDARQAVTPRTGAVSRALISFGGADIANWTGVAIEALTSARISAPQIDVVIGEQCPRRSEVESACAERGFQCHVQPPDIARIMAASDLAIGAGGVTMWERCCVGAPAIAVDVAENQREQVRAAALRGLVYAVPGVGTDTSRLADHITALAGSASLREMLSRNGLHTVDGHGAARVARAMGADALYLREATAADAGALLEWRNDESVRPFTRRQDHVTPAEHQRWLQAVLSDANRVLLIGERNGQPAGVVRFDITGDQAEVSVYRVPRVEGPGIGVRLLCAAEEWLRARRPDVTLVTAEVLGPNARSHHMLQAAGYHLRTAAYERRLRP